MENNNLSFEVQDETTGMTFSVATVTTEDGQFVELDIDQECAVYLDKKEAQSLAEKLNDWINNEETLCFEVCDEEDKTSLFSVSDEHTEDGPMAHFEISEDYTVMLGNDDICRIYDLLVEFVGQESQEASAVVLAA